MDFITNENLKFSLFPYLWCRAGIPTYRPYLFAVFGQVPELEFPDIKAVFSLTGFRSSAEVGHR